METEPDIQAIVNKNYILVKSKYEYADLCRSIPSGKWHKEKKFWYYPYSISLCKAVVEVFEEVENKDISQEILDAANELVNAQKIKSAEDLPPIPKTKMKPWMHQLRTFWFSQSLSGAGLLFDMGAGKTKTAIDLIINSDDKKVLILCPNNVVRVWPKEFEKHADDGFVVVPCEKNSVEKKTALAIEAYEKYDKVAIVVNYESAWRNSMGAFIKSVHWDRIILDESHRAKQYDGKLGKFTGELKAARKNILTGTPMPHSPMDIFAQYRFLDPGVFGLNFYKFRNHYAIMGGYMNKQIVGYQNLDELHEKIYSIAFRVTKDVLDLPEENHIIRDFDMNDEAWKYYRQADSELGIMIGEDKVRTDIVVTQLLRMQQITSGYLPIMREYYDDNDKLHRELDRVERIDSGKASLLEEILEDIDEHEPIVVFTRFKHDLDEIKAAAERLGRVYGELSSRNKFALNDKAELADGIQVAGVQIQAGGVGIDLTKARYGIYYSVGHSLGDYEQSLARIHRPGQTKPVIYYHLVAANTYDETIYASLAAKKDVVESILERKRDEKACL
jgi:SNF2 family DNA or RNA helicase